MRNIVALLVMSSFMCLSLYTVAQEDYQNQRVRVYGDAESLHQLNHQCIGTCGVEQRSGYIEGDFSPFEMNCIKNSGLEYTVLFENASDYYKHRNVQANLLKAPSSDCVENSSNEYIDPSNFSLGSMSGFYTYQEILDHLDLMHELYPNLIQERAPIGDFLTHEERSIFHTIITGEGTQEKGQVLYNALHHAREPVSVTQLIYYMWYLLENYDSDPNIQFIVDNNELHFVPCVNPDGYIYNQEIYLSNGNFGFWRKNKRDNNEDGVFDPFEDGVDLNRNYDQAWGFDDLGSSDNPGSEVYRGTSSFSEPETQAIKHLCENNEFTVALNYHTHGDILIYPWGYGESLFTPDSTYYEELAAVMTSENNYFPGTVNQTLGYLSNGGADDWMYGEQSTKNKIFAFVPECGPTFYPDESEIVGICQQSVFMNLTAARASDSYGVVEELTEGFVQDLEGGLDFSVKQISLIDGAFALTVSPLTNGVTLISNSEVTDVLEGGDVDLVNFVYMIDGYSVTLGQEIEFEVLIDNGTYSYVQTVKKIWLGNDLDSDAFFVDSCQELGNWNNVDFGWGLSTSEYHSEPSSLTESPNGNYLDNIQSSVIYKDTFDLSTVSYAELSFWALWDIEKGYDYVQLSAVVLPEMSEVPLCGLYTSINPNIDEPVYDGYQGSWVEEYINLTEFSGSEIQLKYEFYSDANINQDGFYLDDLKIVMIDTALMDTTLMDTTVMDTTVMDTTVMDTTVMDTTTTIISIENLLNPNILSNPVPNPSDDQVLIEYQWNQAGDLPTLVMFNQLGQIVEQRSLEAMEGIINVSVADWMPGIYFYYLQSENNQSSVKRLVR